ncbi:MAG: hypothetical protein RLZZ408_1452 [Verrucomicrobiota bacterium]
MKLENLRSLICDWASDRGVDCKLEYEENAGILLEKTTPPYPTERPVWDGSFPTPLRKPLVSLLHAKERATYGPHILLTVEAPESVNPRSRLGFWIPSHGRRGTVYYQVDGNCEVRASWIPEFTDEKDLIAYIDSETTRLLQ